MNLDVIFKARLVVEFLVALFAVEARCLLDQDPLVAWLLIRLFRCPWWWIVGFSSIWSRCLALDDAIVIRSYVK